MPELEVEIGGEAYPKEVREHQEASRRVGTPEGHKGNQDSQPENNNIQECQSWTLQAEEKIGPKRVQSQLTKKQAQGANGIRPTVPAPHQPGSYGHHGIEQGPNRTKDPRRRCQGGFDQAGIPLSGLEPGTDPSGAEGDCQPEAQADPE